VHFTVKFVFIKEIERVRCLGSNI